MIRLRSGRKFNQRGYTFNELLVAMAIGVAFVMSAALNTASMFRHQAVNSNATIALQLAQDKLEELQARRKPADENRCPWRRGCRAFCQWRYGRSVRSLLADPIITPRRESQTSRRHGDLASIYNPVK